MIKNNTCQGRFYERMRLWDTKEKVIIIFNSQKHKDIEDRLEMYHGQDKVDNHFN